MKFDEINNKMMNLTSIVEKQRLILEGQDATLRGVAEYIVRHGIRKIWRLVKESKIWRPVKDSDAQNTSVLR